jgi:hypothetical protein
VLIKSARIGRESAFNGRNSRSLREARLRTAEVRGRVIHPDFVPHPASNSQKDSAGEPSFSVEVHKTCQKISDAK